MNIHDDEHGLTMEEVRQFRENGYYGPFRVLSEQEATILKEELTEIREAEEHPLNSGVFPKRDRHRDTKEIWDLVSCDEIVHKIRSLYGKHALLWVSNILEKPPGDMKIAPHQDAYFNNNQPGNSISAWTALNRIDEENGCVTVYPGTHTRDYPHVDPPEKENVYPEPTTDPNYYDTSNSVKMELKPGESFLFNARTVHGSYPNSSDRPRVGLVGRYIPPFINIDYSHERLYEEGGVTPVSGENWTGLNPTVEPPTE